MDINEKKEHEKLSKSKCVICDSVDICSSSYKYKQIEKLTLFASVKRGSAFNFSLEVPTCPTCKQKFHRWSLYNLGSNAIYVLGLLSAITGICFLILQQFMGDKGIPLLILGFLIVITGLILRYIVGKISSNPSNYFFFDFLSNNFYIRPNGEENWILYKPGIKNGLDERV